MKTICVITGGGSGMGLAAAKELGKEHYIVIVGRTIKKLESAIRELHTQGIEAESRSCDISNRDSVNQLATHCASLGKVAVVIHAAGMSPHMGNAKTIMETNAIGTININNAFFNILDKGACIIDLSSMSGYMIPKIIIPGRSYRLCRIDEKKFVRKMMSRVNLFPKKLRPFISYGISKNFVIWFAKTDASRFGEKGVRVLSVSPGTFETPMGELEKENADEYLKYCAIKRNGHVEEMAQLLSFCASEKAGYLTGADILCDGGCVAGRMKIGYDF